MRRRSPILALALLVVAGVGASAGAASANPGPARSADPAAAADALAASASPELRKSPDDTMVRTGMTASTNGLKYFSYERTYRGLSVVGGDMIVVTNSAGRVLNTAVAQDRVIAVDTTAKIGAGAALATARGQLAAVDTESTPRLVVLAWGSPRLAWEVKLTGTKANGAPSVLTVFVDAVTGRVADSVDAVREGTGNSFYVGTVAISTSGSGTSFSMSDPVRPGIRCGGQNGVTFTGTDDVWGNGSGTNLETACVDALFDVQTEWDMLRAWLGRNGIDGQGRGFPAEVGLNQVNAFWNGSLANFGHSQDNLRQATSMDVVGHEFGHAIFQFTPGGAGSGNENGGLNEGDSDIFGALTEAFANNPNDPPDFTVGEEVNLTGTGPIRIMYDPSLVGDPACWSTAIPNTEVHDAAGPLDHWFYLVSQGSNPATGPQSPTCNNSTVTGIGIQDAGRIWYNALLQKTSTWRYANARVASLNAAVNLFGADSAQCATVKAAWDAVSVPPQSGEPTCAGGGGGGGGGTTVFSDDFETSKGWVRNPNNTDTAATGVWERGDPEPTSSNGVVLQLGTTTSGVNDLVTGRLAGSSAGANDVDGGVTTAQSPTITLPATGTLTLTFSWYLAHLSNATGDDFFRVSVVTANGTTTVFSQLGAAVNRPGAWATATVDLTGFAGQDIQLRVQTADNAGGSLIEGGVDDVSVVQN